MFQPTMNYNQGTSIKLYCIKFKLLCVNLSMLAAMEITYIKLPFHIYTKLFYKELYTSLFYTILTLIFK